MLSDSSLVRLDSMTTTSSSCFFSLPSSWAFLGSFQTCGSSNDALTVLRRSDLASKSKIPPEGLGTGRQVGELAADLVDAFCVHVRSLDSCESRIFARAAARRPLLLECAQFGLRAPASHGGGALQPANGERRITGSRDAFHVSDAQEVAHLGTPVADAFRGGLA